MANVNIRLGNKSSAWFSANPTLVLLSGQLVYLDDQSGQYKKGDGTTQLSALSFLGGGGSGLTSVGITGSDFSITGSPLTSNGSISLTLASVNSNVGTFNNVTVNAKGLVTSASNVSYLTSLTGTSNRITVSGSTIDIASTYVGQSSITTLGTIGTGVWQGTSIGTAYTDAKIKGTIAANQIGFGSGADTLAGSNDFTWSDSTKLAYLNGRIGVGVAAVNDTLVSLKGTSNTGTTYLNQSYNSDNNLIVRQSNLYTGNPTSFGAFGTEYAHSVGMYGFTSFGQNEIYHGGNSYNIDNRAQIRFHTSGSHQFIIGEQASTVFGIYTNTGSNWALQIDTAGTAYLNNKVHVRGFDATYGIAPLNVYAKTAAEGYNYSGSLGVNIVAVGSSCYPILAFSENGTSNSYGSILWQDSAYDALTGSSIGTQAFFSCYNDSGKGLLELRVNNNIGTTAPTTVISALGNALTVGSSGGSLGFYGTTPIAKPTTAFSSGTYAAVGGTTIQTSDTFAAPSGDLYTQPQINRIILTLLGL